MDNLACFDSESVSIAIPDDGFSDANVLVFIVTKWTIMLLEKCGSNI